MQEGPKYSIGGNRYKENPEAGRMPGPGTYAADNQKTGPAFSMLGRHNDSSKPSNPGPADYEGKN